jgi:hypothetical protein
MEVMVEVMEEPIDSVQFTAPGSITVPQIRYDIPVYARNPGNPEVDGKSWEGEMAIWDDKLWVWGEDQWYDMGIPAIPEALAYFTTPPNI